MQTLKLQVQHIDSKTDLMAWVIDRLGEIGPFELVTEELDRRCDHMIETLIEDQLDGPIDFVPLTANAIERARASALKGAKAVQQRSAALLSFFGDVGTMLETCDLQDVVIFDDVMGCAMDHWTDGAGLVYFQEHREKMCTSVHSSAAVTLEYNVLIGVRY